MSDHLKTQPSTKQRLSPSLVGGIMGIIAVLSPIALSYNIYGWGEMNSMVIAMMWQVYIYSWRVNFDPSGLIASLPLTCLRIVFVVMMIRLYQGKSTKKRTLLVGFASALQLAAVFYGVMIFDWMSYPSFNPFSIIIIPVPILFVIGLLIMQFYPPEEGTMWIEEEKTSSWWEKADEETTTTTEQPKEKIKKSKEPESPW